MKRLLAGLAIIAGLAICGINARAQTAVYKTFTLTDTVTTYAYLGLAGQSTCTVTLGSAAALGGGTVSFLTSADGGTSYQAVTGFTDLGLPGNNPQNNTQAAGTKYTVPVAGQTAIEVVLSGSSGASVPGSLNCNGGVARANAGPPLVRYGPVPVATSTTLPDLILAGQSTCSMTISGGTATLTPQGSSDGGTTYATPSPGATTASGTTGVPAAPNALTNFHIAVSGVSGTPNVAEACSGAQVAVSSSTPPPNLYVLHGKVNAGSISAGVLKNGTFTVAENSTGFTPTWDGTSGTLSVAIPASYTAQKMFFDVRSSISFTAITGGTAGSIIYANQIGADVTDPTSCSAHVESADLGTFTISCLNSAILYNAGDGPITVQFGISGTASISGNATVQFDMLAVPT